MQMYAPEPAAEPSAAAQNWHSNAATVWQASHQQQHPVGPNAGHHAGSAAHADFSIDELGHLGSAFDDDEEEPPARFLAHSAAQKRPADAPLDTQWSKRRAVHAGQEASEGLRIERAANGSHVNGAVPQSTKAMKHLAARVAQGELSPAGRDVRDRLRKLPPGEGLSILAWLVDSLSRNVDHKAAPQVEARIWRSVLWRAWQVTCSLAFAGHCLMFQVQFNPDIWSQC
jgi:hypothetical protein